MSALKVFRGISAMVYVSGLLARLGERRFQIEREIEAGNESPLARSTVEECGCKYGGFGFVSISGPHKYFVFLGRDGRKDYRKALVELSADGYMVISSEVNTRDAKERVNFIFGKEYKGGGTALADRSQLESRNPVAIASTSDMGVFLDTKPEHFGIVEELARHLGVESQTIDVPDVFKKAFGEM